MDFFSPVITYLVTGSIALLPYFTGARFSQRPERWLPFALGVLVFVVSPHYVLSTAYFYQRLGVFLVPLWFLAWDPPARRTRRLEWLGMGVVVIWALMICGRFASFARETESRSRQS